MKNLLLSLNLSFFYIQTFVSQPSRGSLAAVQVSNFSISWLLAKQYFSVILQMSPAVYLVFQSHC